MQYQYVWTFLACQNTKYVNFYRATTCNETRGIETRKLLLVAFFIRKKSFPP